MFRFPLAFLMLPALCLRAADAPQTLRYVIMSNGAVAGSEVDTYSAGGSNMSELRRLHG